MNISDGIERMSRRFPNKVAIVAEDARITYGELDDSANRVARHLITSRGLSAGDRVGIVADNTIQFLEAFYGVIRAGCIAAPLSGHWSAWEFASCLDNCRPSLVLARSGTADRFSYPVPVVDLGNGPRIDPLPPAQDSLAELAKPGEDAPFYIGYTSGSTGRPKGVLRRDSSWLNSYLSATIEFGCSSEDRVLAPGVLFYSLSLFAVTHALFLGSTAYIMPEFDSRKVLTTIENERVTTLCMVPTLYEALLNVKNATKRDLSSVRTLICAGSTWPRALEAKGKVLALFPSAGLYEYYGASEMSFVSVSYPEDQMTRPRSVGKPFLGVRVEIRDKSGGLARPGEVGTLYARSSFGFEGYYGDPVRTAEVRQGDWMTVGDLGYADDEGYLYVVGRQDNVVVTGGMKVSVEEVEEVLNDHPKVQIAAVIGAEDPQRGQLLVAFVQKEEGVEITSRELRTHCADRLASFKVPRRWQIVDALPLTSTGKVSRPDLRQLLNELATTRTGSRR